MILKLYTVSGVSVLAYSLADAVRIVNGAAS